MVTIKVTPGMDPTLMLIEYAEEIRNAGIEAIEECIELKLDEAFVAEFDVEGHFTDLVLPKKKWKKFLKDAIEPLTANEEFMKVLKVQELLAKV